MDENRETIEDGVCRAEELEVPFSYQDYQVVRREFFAHIKEPAITFDRYRIYVNMACLRKLPLVDHVQILVAPDAKKLVLRPCGEDDKDSLQWRSNSRSGRKPKQITCRIFFAKIMELMGWAPELRYKLLGKLIRSNEEQLLLFDLTAPQTFRHIALEQGEQKHSRIPIFPVEWKTRFGLSAEEHRHSLQIDLFRGYTVFGIRIPGPPLPVGPQSEDDNDMPDIWMERYGKEGAQDGP